MTFWMKGGLLCTTCAGNPINCDTCACNQCNQCDKTPSEIDIEFTANPNYYGPGCAAGCGSCADWVATWALKLLGATVLANLFATYPNTFLDYLGNVANEVGCWFGLITTPTFKLPCCANFMAVRVNDGGGDGFANLTLFIGWEDGVWAALEGNITLKTVSKDCVHNLTQDDGNVFSWFVTWSTGGTPPCDFEAAFLSPATFIWTALP